MSADSTKYAAKYSAKISWTRDGSAFSDNLYSRAHVWGFDGGVQVPASSSPHSVPIPLSDPANVDPEEAFIASVSSCHMLWFLAIAAKKRFVVDNYVDEAIGVMEKNQHGKLAMTHITLHPSIAFIADHLPTDLQVQQMHELAHENCYIANSIHTLITIESAPSLSVTP